MKWSEIKEAVERSGVGEDDEIAVLKVDMKHAVGPARRGGHLRVFDAHRVVPPQFLESQLAQLERADAVACEESVHCTRRVISRAAVVKD